MLDSGAYSVYALQHHSIQAVKYRKGAFGNEGTADFLGQG
jgi:REP element-mobilizing transposase RayT